MLTLGLPTPARDGSVLPIQGQLRDVSGILKQLFGGQFPIGFGNEAAKLVPKSLRLVLLLLQNREKAQGRSAPVMLKRFLISKPLQPINLDFSSRSRILVAYPGVIRHGDELHPIPTGPAAFGVHRTVRLRGAMQGGAGARTLAKLGG
ncbi:hypothetical protein MTYM_01492 [Methylococcales bacterium]|nr:hypothetical protein MTYM_01492 [Methylococcales bacterium]